MAASAIDSSRDRARALASGVVYARTMYRASSSEDRSILVSAFNGKVFGLDRATGQPRWSINLHAHGGEVELAVQDGMVVACTPSLLTFIRYDNGQVVKQVPLVGAYPRRPIMMIDGRQIFVARNGEVACYTLGGDPLWVQPFDGMGMGSVALGFPGAVRQADDSGPG